MIGVFRHDDVHGAFCRRQHIETDTGVGTALLKQLEHQYPAAEVRADAVFFAVCRHTVGE